MKKKKIGHFDIEREKKTLFERMHGESITLILKRKFKNVFHDS